VPAGEVPEATVPEALIETGKDGACGNWQETW